MSARIEDYALIGDLYTAALVACDGSIDWMCVPRFDSGACFAALLGTANNGRWLLGPRGEVRATRRKYRDGTLILETEHETAEGTAVVIDCMPLHSGTPTVVRVVEGRRGRTPMHLELAIRCDYGSIVPWVQRLDHNGLSAIAGPDRLVFRTDIPLVNKDFKTSADFTVAEGERVSFTLSWHRSHKPPPASIDSYRCVEETNKWWREWSGRCTYKGPWHDAVLRSLITLKALTFAPTGGILAAATTSLPEKIGGVRNWDYRYCWLRDATFTLYAMLGAGYVDEARAWRAWLHRAVAGDPATTNIMYGLAGERRLPEMELDWLPGYEGSKPVRIGNAASKQFQLDVYGEVVDAMYQSRRFGLQPEKSGWAVVKALTDFVVKASHEPDEGIWEVRGPRRHFTHSKVLCWVAFDRAVAMVEQAGYKGPVDRWRATRDEIHASVLEQGFDRKRGAFTQTFGSRELDASVLMIPLVGFLPGDDPRVVSTIDVLLRELTEDGFVCRYEPTDKGVDGIGEPEGVFLPCSFWMVEALALGGRRPEAQALFERLLGIANDLGLFAEEYDPTARRFLGNFPQAFTHLALVAAAHTLAPERSPQRTRRRDLNS
jgi:GH15 family glucan-1,4-alpha-glucosidase